MAGTLSVGAILTLRDSMSAGLDRARGSAKRFVDQIHTGSSHVSNFTDKVVGAGKKIVDNFGAKAGAMLDNFFGKLKLGAGLAAAALGAMAFKSIETSMTFEANIRHATGLLVANGASSDQADAAFKQFADGILTMAPQLGKAPDELSKSLYLPLSVMVKMNDVGASVSDTLKVVAAASKAATAGFADASTVTTALSRVLGAYGASADEAAHYTDIMQQAVNYGLMTFSDLAAGIGQVAGPAAALHVPFEQVAAAIATITRRGIVPDEAFTALNKFMLAIEKPHPEAQTALEEMFGPQWKDHFSATALAAEGLSGVLDDLMGHVKPTTEQLAKLDAATTFGTDEDIRAAGADILGSRVDQLIGVIGDVRGLRGVLALTAQGGGTSFAEALGLTGNSVGAVDKQFKEYTKTTQYAKDQFMSFIDVIKESVFGAVLPSLGDKLKGASAALADLVSGSAFQEADTGGKIGMIVKLIGDGLSQVPDLAAAAGSSIWHAITGWWNDHQDEVRKDVNDFFAWLGDVGVPWAIETGGKLGGFLGEALIHTITGLLTNPTAWAAAGIAIGLKFALPAVGLGGGGAAAAQSEAAAGLSAAATQLQAAAAALMEASGAEEVAAGELGAEGAAGKLSGAGGLLSAGWLANVTSVTLAAGTVYFAAKTYIDEKGKVGAARAGQNEATGQALRTGDLPGIARGYKAAGEPTMDQQLAGNIFGGGTSAENIDVRVSKYVGNQEGTFGTGTGKLDDAIRAHSTEMVDQMFNSLKSSGVWDSMGADMKNMITARIADANAQIEASYAKDNVQRMIAAGITNIPGFGDTSKMSTDEINRKLNDPMTFRDPGVVDQVNKFSTSMQEAKPHLESIRSEMQKFKDSLPPGSLMASLVDSQIKLIDKIMSFNPAGNPGGEINPNLNQPGYFSTAGDKIGAGIGPPNLNQPGYFSKGSGSSGPVKRFAKGGYGTLTGATLMVAGEAGTEDYAFAPHSKGGLGALLGGHGRGGVTVMGPLIANATVREDADVEKIADKLADELEKRAANGGHDSKAPF